MDNVHFNLHFNTGSSGRLFASEVEDILSYSLNMTNLIPEIDLDSLLITGEQSAVRGRTCHGLLLIREKEKRTSAASQEEIVPQTSQQSSVQQPRPEPPS